MSMVQVERSDRDGEYMIDKHGNYTQVSNRSPASYVTDNPDVNPNFATDFGLLWDGHSSCTECIESTFQTITHRIHQIDLEVWDLDAINGPIFGYNVHDARLGLNASVIVVKQIGSQDDYQAFFTLMHQDRVFDYQPYHLSYAPRDYDGAFGGSSTQIILADCGFKIPATTTKFSKIGVESWVVDKYIDEIVNCITMSNDSDVKHKECWSSQEPGLNPSWKLKFIDPRRFTSHAYLAYAYVCSAINLHLNSTFIQIGRHEKRHLQDQLIQKFVDKMCLVDSNVETQYQRIDLERIVSSWPKWFNTTDVIKNVKKLKPDFIRNHPIYKSIRWRTLK